MIKPEKFVTDLWGMMQMAIDEAVAAEREACAVLCEQLSDTSRDLRFGAAIRARGQE